MELGTYWQNFAHTPLSIGTGAAHVLVQVFGSCWGESPAKAAHRRRYRDQLKSVHWSYIKLVAGAACTGIVSCQQPANDNDCS